MIIPFTDRLKAKPVIIIASIVFLVQLLERTDTIFALLTFAFILISALAYNAGHGLSFPAGAYIFFNASLTAGVGILYKLLLRDPGQSNLLAPNTTLAAYCVGMIVMGFAAALSHRLRPKRPLLPNLDAENMRFAAIGCLFAGFFVQILTLRSPNDPGTIFSALTQLNKLLEMAIIFGTVYQIQKSGGKSATNWIVWVSGVLIFGFGIVAFSKEGMFTAPFTWALTAILYRFRFSWKHIVTLVVFAAFADFILVPFSQYGRRSKADSPATQGPAAQAAIEYLKDPFGTRALYLEQVESQDSNGSIHFFTSEQPFMERLIMFAIDDAVISLTNEGNVFGLYPTYADIGNVIPRFLWKDKPDTAFGNTYGHELGLLAADDTTTGISFSPVADAYHQAKWFGILCVFPPIVFLYFFITESLTGGMRDTPYALLPIALSAHIAPEGMLGGAIYLQTYGAFFVIFIAFTAKYVLARFTRLAMGGDRTRVQRTRDFFLGPRAPSPSDPVDNPTHAV